MSGVITFGISYRGKVDRVPGRCYVVTKVFQVVNVPLVPLGGYLVREGTEKETFVSGLLEFEGARIPISWKSFAWAWLRVFFFAFGVVPGLLPAMLGLHGKWAFLLLGPLLSIAMLVAWWKTRRGLRASPARASVLEGQIAGLPAATATLRSGRT